VATGNGLVGLAVRFTPVVTPQRGVGSAPRCFETFAHGCASYRHGWRVFVFAAHYFKEEIMLVISRDHKESVTLLDRKTGEVLGTVGLTSNMSNVRIGFNLCDSIRVVRTELVDDYQRAKESIASKG
jgi:sRNA-binding carbon storage regulator CsrA